MGKLTDTKIKALKPASKPFRAGDSDAVKGLFLLVHPNGSKYWRMSYTLNDKRNTYAIGTYPDINLTNARKMARSARALVAQGKDPITKRKNQTIQEKQNTFESVAEQWHRTNSTKWKPNHAKDVWATLQSNVIKYLGTMPVNSITTSKLLAVLRRIESRGSLEILKKVRQWTNQVFIYAKVTGLIESNPAEGLETVLQTPKTKNHNSITLKELPELIKAIQDRQMEPTTKAGLLLTLYTFLRTNELRNARWNEIDFDKAQWTVPAERMKMNREHVVPLSKQAMDVLRHLKPLTGHFPFVFASYHKPDKQPMSQNAMIRALYRMGYGGRMTVHGFRHLASTSLNELGFDGRHIEKQLSHEDKNTIRGTYNKAEYLPERAKMMQFWADFVDNLDTDKVVPINRKINQPTK